MNTEQQIKQFLVAIGDAFPGVAKTSTLEIYFQSLKGPLAKLDLDQLRKKIIHQCEFFPSVRKILDISGQKTQTRRELATEFVDTMLSVLQSSHNFYEYVGTDNARLWKQTVNITKADLQQLEPQFHRTSWIDCVERAYLNYDQEQVRKKLAESENKKLGGQSEGA
jgi:hypothetical protein